MKQLLIGLFAVLVLMATPVSAQTVYDPDGLLVSVWLMPDTVGMNPFSHFLLSYTINGAPDAVEVVTSNLVDSSAILATPGDWAVFNLRSVSTLGDTSVVVYSDTVRYDRGTGVNPPGGLNWIVD